MSSIAISAHALLSDCHSAALVTTDGSVDWMCCPRFDSPSVFARMLDDRAGHWLLRPVAEHTSSRRYLDQTLVLETTFHTATGTVTVTDAMCMGPENRGHGLGQGAPHLLIRSATGVAGEVEVDLTYRPRPEYGLLRPLLSHVDGGVATRGGAENLVLSSPVGLEFGDSTATGRFTLRAGDTVRFGLHRSTLEGQPSRVWSQEELADRLAATVTAWQSWSDLHQHYDGPWQDEVQHSGRVLRGLTFQPTGAVVAAATTSLPEGLGGKRNWDYRYSWARDSSFTLDALWVAACPDEANDFFAFMTTAAASALGPDEPLQIMFGVGGEHDLSERTLPHLTGWRNNRPVRVGNAAWNQHQIDVYGELLDVAERLAQHITDMDVDVDIRGFLVGLAESAARRWRLPDRGIWEVRGEPQHFLYSKVMCWVALDRAIKLAGKLNAADRVDEWRATKAQIWRTVIRDGWSESAGAYTQSFGSEALDASVLIMPLVRFLAADDPRMLATIDAIAQRLTDENGLVYRYRTDDGADGLTGTEGTFLLCTFWLAQSLAMAGRLEEARAAFARAAGYANDVGLLAEEVDTATGELMGNFPQAFSHIGLVLAAWEISKAEQRRDAETRPW
jgi:GH15 family glucan-1,4-alpha-glucosidase